MARPPRTAKTGIPVPAATKRLDRVATIRMLMSEGLYRGEATKESFARDWKVSRATVDDYAREASRSISLDVSEDPSELLVQVGAMFRAVAADTIQRVQDERDERGTLVGSKGHMSHGAAVGYYQTAISAAKELAALVHKTPEAFIPEHKRVTEDANTSGMPSVQVVVKYHATAEPPPPPAEAPPAPPAEPQVPPK